MYPQETIEAKKTAPTAVLKKLYEKRLAVGAPIQHNGQTYHFQLRVEARTTWLMMVHAVEKSIEAGAPTSAPYPSDLKTYENTRVPTTLQGLLDYADYLQQYGQALWDAKQVVQSEIDNGTITDASQVETAFDSALQTILNA